MNANEREWLLQDEKSTKLRVGLLLKAGGEALMDIKKHPYRNDFIRVHSRPSAVQKEPQMNANERELLLKNAKSTKLRVGLLLKAGGEVLMKIKKHPYRNDFIRVHSRPFAVQKERL